MNPTPLAAEPCTIGLVPPSQTRHAIEIVARSPRLNPGDQQRQLAAFLDYARSPAVISTRHAGAFRHDRLIAACLCYVHADRTGMMFIPLAEDHPTMEPELHDLLVWQRRFVPADQVRLLQLMADPAGSRTERLIESSGFHRLADLHYLQCRVRDGRRPETPPESTWMPYSPESHPLFAETLQATYHESLDCPALAGVRPIDDVITGHRNVGRFEPALWQILLADESPAGVLIAACHDDHRAIEIVYMGVVPTARGRGLGAILLQRANELAQMRNMRNLTLAVDGANEPAMRTYLRFGFTHRTTRRAFIALPRTIAPSYE